MKVDDYRVCNCAACRKVMLGESMRRTFKAAPPDNWEYVAGRVLGRPYCAACLAARHPLPKRNR